MKKALLYSHTGSIHSRFNRANIEAFRDLGFELHLMANFENGVGPENKNQEFVNWCSLQGFIVHNVPYIRGKLLKNASLTKELKAFLREQKFDIVHAHTESGGFLLRLALAAKGHSKFVYTAHGMSFWKGCPMKNRIIYKNMERWICSGMDVNLGMNSEEVASLKAWKPESCRYVHGVGLNIARMQSPVRSREEVRTEFALAEGEKMIVSIGELDDNKNHSTVIKALARLGRKDFKYVVCGVGPNKDMLLSLAASLGLSDNVILAGYRSDIPDVLNAADLFVFPSYHEGMPVSALEAMACGLPVVCSRIRGNVDIVEDGDNGYLFEPSDEAALAEKLGLLMDNPQKRLEMGAKNREIVKDFSMEAVTEELKAIYGSIC